jgi:hypothetical protein
MRNARRYTTIAVIAATSLVSSACTEDEAPLTPADAGLAAEAWVVPQEEVTAFVEERGGTVDFAVVGRGEQPVVVARVDWVPNEPSPGTRLQIVVLDPSGQNAATTFWVSSSDVDVSIGWDGRYEVLADRYPWLGATRSMEDAYGDVESTMSVAFPPDGAGPLWLVAAFPRASAIGIARRNDEPIVGAFLTSDPDERIWWAEQLTGPSDP